MLAFYLMQLEAPAAREFFRGFYRRHQQPMYQFALAILKKSALAEDAVHNAFLSMMGEMEKLSRMGEEEQYAFAMVLTRNKAVDLLRQEKQQQPAGELTERLSDPSEPKDGFTILDGLPELYSTVLRLVGLGFKPAEIARMQNKEITTVYKQIARSKDLLREKLREEGYHGY